MDVALAQWSVNKDNIVTFVDVSEFALKNLKENPIIKKKKCAF